MALAELVPEAPQVERDVERVQQASRDDSYRDFWRSLRQMAPVLRRVADYAEQNWFELREQDQDELLKLKESLDQIFQLKQPTVPVVARFLLSDDERKIAWAFGGATARFRSVIEVALKNQYLQQQSLLEKMSSDPEIVAEIARGEAEFRAHAGTRFTAEEFKKRFSLT